MVANSSTSAPPMSHSSITYGHSTNADFVSQTNHTSSFVAATGGPTGSRGYWHVNNNGVEDHGHWSSEPEKIDQDRLRKHPLGQFISKVADQHKAIKQTVDDGISRIAQQIVPPRPPLPTTFSFQSSNAKIAEEHKTMEQMMEEEIIRAAELIQPFSPTDSESSQQGDATEEHKEHKAYKKLVEEEVIRVVQRINPFISVGDWTRLSSNASSTAAEIVTAKKLTELREKLKHADEEALATKKEALKAKLSARRDGSAHGLLSLSNSYPFGPHSGSTHQDEHSLYAANRTSSMSAQASSGSASTEAPPLPPRPIIFDPTSFINNVNSDNSFLARQADILRRHTNTILRHRSPSPSTSQSTSQSR